MLKNERELREIIEANAQKYLNEGMKRWEALDSVGNDISNLIDKMTSEMHEKDKNQEKVYHLGQKLGKKALVKNLVKNSHLVKNF